MHPELFKLPFVDLTVKSYGLMMVIGFICAISLIRRLSRNITPDPQMITNAALYSLIAGVVGARIFYVIHYFGKFKGDLLSVFAIWKGGLEVLGGLFLAVSIILAYLYYHKLPIRRYLDILGIALVLALAFGRIGCFSNGCCYGKPSNVPWAVRFPYASIPYLSQIYPDVGRGRFEPQLKLPNDFSIFHNSQSGIVPQDLKPFDSLTAEQKEQVTKGPYRCLPVHPTQLYSSALAFLGSFLLYLFWKRAQNAEVAGKNKFLIKSGSTFALMFILYGTARFFLEFLRDDNPFETAWWILYKGGTVSQNLGIYMVIFGGILMAVFAKMKPDAIASLKSKPAKAAT